MARSGQLRSIRASSSSARPIVPAGLNTVLSKIGAKGDGPRRSARNSGCMTVQTE